ncbi:hypothetical protein ACQ4M3_26290 [Leptolyngbya sp. AN03gr2]|uniref:hypothetical protein n=1 Tax=unclassified Leptolyngbya TaxID=2650499 RepID=UPI003D311F68
MPENVRYITDETGKQISVVLDLEAYQQLLNPLLIDKKCLVGLTREELETLANCRLASSEQAGLEELLIKQSEGSISAAERVEMDRILVEADRLMVLKARASYTLKRLDEAATVG